VNNDILGEARIQVLNGGARLDTGQVLRVLRLPDDRLGEALLLAHEVRMRWCAPEVEVEGIVSVKTGGCPEDCHFCSQSGGFSSPVRPVWLDVAELVDAAKATAAAGATEFCIVAAVRGPDERLMSQVSAAVWAIRDAVGINVACSLGILTAGQAAELAALGVHRYNHNLETARSYFGQIVTTHGWQERYDTCELVKSARMELCCGGIVGMGETLAQRAELASELAGLGPDEVPLNFLNPRPGTPLGGINAIIVGNYLTTLGRPAEADLEMLGRLRMPIKALTGTV
jgi:biotin synthase